MRRRNIIAALVLLAFGAGYGILTTQLPVRSLPDTPGPPFFPWINTIAILALSATLLVQGLMEKVGADGPVPAPAAGRQRAIWALAVFVVYLAVLPGLGFILATAPFFAALMVLFGEARPLRVVLGALIATGILYLLFRHGFNVFLPTGVLKGIVP